jgi:hypothetical protein
VVPITIRRQSTEPVDVVRARLCALFPDDAAEVTRQIDLAIACAEHLNIRVTPELLENLVAEHLHARTASKPARFRVPPAVPLVVARPRKGDNEVPKPGSAVTSWGGKAKTASKAGEAG